MSHEHYEIAHHHSQTVEHWKKISAITTTFWALSIAISSFGIENANHHSLLSKNEAVDQWSFFQAKDLKEKFYEIESKTLSFADQADKYYEEKAYLAQEYKENVSRYQKEQDDIMKKAKEFTYESEYYDKKGNYLELAQVFFELAIVLNAIFLLADRNFMFQISMISGLVGLGIFIIGFFFY